MIHYDLSPSAAEKLVGADLRAFAAADDGIRPVLVELVNPAPRAGAGDLAMWTRPVFGRLPPGRATISPSESATDDWATRMDDLEHDLIALGPLEGPTRINLARGFTLTVTPSILRALTCIPHVGVIRPRQAVQTA